VSQGPGIIYKFSQTGVEDLTNKIKQLHQEFANGQITYKQYHSSILDATSQGRAATSEFNQMKGAIAAANPGLLEFTRSMSLFGGVANTVLSITNAINLAQLAGAGISSQLAQDQSAAAAAYNEYIKDLNSYGPADSRTVAAYNQYHAMLNQVTFDQNQLARQSITTTVTLIASGISIAGSISNTVMAFKALSAEMSPVTAENFAIGLAGVGGVLVSWGLPIAAGIAGIAAFTYLMEQISPTAKNAFTDLQTAIEKTFNLDPVTAWWVGLAYEFVGGLARIGDYIENGAIAWYNGILTNFINPLIQIWDATVGKITGQISTISPAQYIQQSNNDIMAELGLNVPNSQASNADAINQMFTGTPGGLGLAGSSNTPVPSTLLNPVNTTAQMSSALKAGQDAANQYLNAINTNSIATNTLATQSLNQQAQTTAAINAYKDSVTSQISTLQSQLGPLLAQPQTMQQTVQTGCTGSVGSGDVWNPGSPIYGTQTVATPAATQAAQLQKQIASLQSQVPVLDNATSGLATVLNSIGLSANSGIGSVISGALGGFAGVGGAGICATQLANFAQTGDYGVFTKAAMQDNAVTTPSASQQASALLAAWQGMGLTGYTLSDAQRALGQNTGGTGASGSKNVGSGAFGGLAGQYGNGLGSSSSSSGSSSCCSFCCSCWYAEGGSGIVSTPTKIGVGESGPEAVSITPLSKGTTSTGGISITVINQGSILSENNLSDTIMKVLKQALRSGGF